MGLSTELSTSQKDSNKIGACVSSSFDLAVIDKNIGGFDDLFARPDPMKIKDLLDAYAEDVAEIEAVHAFLSQRKNCLALSYLVSKSSINSVAFAKKALSSSYWSKALAMTDVMQHMPASMRAEWNNLIDNCETPLFEQEHVVTTIINLLNDRDIFLAQMVDGVFQSLSKTHVTNSPLGFSQRMIIKDVFIKGNYSHLNMQPIEDLRVVIGKLLGRIQLSQNTFTTTYMIEQLYQKNPGQWQEMDGGSISVKVFKKGTVHIEIHEDLAWRLNDILSVLYPMAIPNASRTRSASIKEHRHFDLHQNLVNGDILNTLKEMEVTYNWDLSGYRPVRLSEKVNAVKTRNLITYAEKYKAVDEFMQLCGGVAIPSKPCEWQFEYDFLAIKDELIWIGRVPDHISHQYFPTEDEMSDVVVDALDIQDGDVICEPSAGKGDIAKKLKATGNHVTVVEISDFNAIILGQQGYDKVVNDDFIAYASSTTDRFDKIGMNPPFSLGRSKLHVETAMKLLKGSGSKLVAIVPQTLKQQLVTEGYDVTWSGLYEKKFKKTNISVVVVEIIKL